MADCAKAIQSLGNFEFVIRGDVTTEAEFNENVSWVFHVSERSQLLREAAVLHPDFILIDLAILKIPKTIDSLRLATPRSRIIALTESKSAPYVKATSNLGLDGMIEKGRIGRDDLNRILELTEEGKTSRKIHFKS